MVSETVPFPQKKFTGELVREEKIGLLGKNFSLDKDASKPPGAGHRKGEVALPRGAPEASKQRRRLCRRGAPDGYPEVGRTALKAFLEVVPMLT